MLTYIFQVFLSLLITAAFSSSFYESFIILWYLHYWIEFVHVFLLIFLQFKRTNKCNWRRGYCGQWKYTYLSKKISHISRPMHIFKGEPYTEIDFWRWLQENENIILRWIRQSYKEAVPCLLPSKRFFGTNYCSAISLVGYIVYSRLMLSLIFILLSVTSF